MKTTLEEIKAHNPCADGWKKLVKNLGRSTGPVTLLEILNNNGPADAYWALRCWDLREYAVLIADVADSVLPFWERAYPDDTRVREAVKQLRAYARGELDEKKLLDQASDAYSAAYSAAIDVAADPHNARAACAAQAARAVAHAAGRHYSAAHSASIVLGGWSINEKLMRDFLREKDGTNGN